MNEIPNYPSAIKAVLIGIIIAVSLYIVIK
jgi:hypothetical protein